MIQSTISPPEDFSAFHVKPFGIRGPVLHALLAFGMSGLDLVLNALAIVGLSELNEAPTEETRSAAWLWWVSSASLCRTCYFSTLLRKGSVHGPLRVVTEKMAACPRKFCRR